MLITTATGESQETTLTDLLARADRTILYFYPKDDTPGCTIEANDFSTQLPWFVSRDIQVIGVSKDSHNSHCKFIKKYGLAFDLVVDSDLVLHRQFATLGTKSMYGKTYEGTIRSTFLLAKDGTIKKERRNVSASGHVSAIQAYILADQTTN